MAAADVTCSDSASDSALRAGSKILAAVREPTIASIGGRGASTVAPTPVTSLTVAVASLTVASVTVATTIAAAVAAGEVGRVVVGAAVIRLIAAPGAVA